MSNDRVSLRTRAREARVARPAQRSSPALGANGAKPFPDFPGADVTGNSIDEVERNAQEAVERMYHSSEQLIPAPTCDTSELRALEMNGGEGIWLFVNINMSRVTSQAIGFQLSLSESLLQQVNAAARERHLTRSAFFTLAVLHELDRKNDNAVFGARSEHESGFLAL
jgi:hypothetical protein